MGSGVAGVEVATGGEVSGSGVGVAATVGVAAAVGVGGMAVAVGVASQVPVGEALGVGVISDSLGVGELSPPEHAPRLRPAPNTKAAAHRSLVKGGRNPPDATTLLIAQLRMDDLPS